MSQPDTTRKWPDLTDILTWLRKTDASHEPGEANDLMTAAAEHIDQLRSQLDHGSGFPWAGGRLADWSIVGMNHYHQDGERRLFVSMERQGRCIKAEGPDTGAIWAELERQAYLVKDTP